ncbi:nitrogen regulation protein NR(I) [Paraburkholderia sp. EG287A]|uniref:nitrogen regulation protein NR(I) n=1 Tax=unclassified Paraburkholderia TaxID=2615204 RepID=UPI0034D26FD5
MKPIWIVDDDQSIRWVLEKALARENFATRSFSNVREAASALDHDSPQVLVSDIRMPGGSGLELLQTVRERVPGLPVIIMTAFSDLDSAVAAFQGGAFEYLAKPFDVDKAVELIRRAVDESMRGEQQWDERPAEAPEMLGQAPAMQDMFRAIGRLSHSAATVLITGESGTGKELVARALHRHSPRANGPFIALNTAAIPKDLLESELFGHERGAFTGAQAMRQGRFEQAENGTLFLDEIGDMPFDLQTRLLRVLSDGQFYRVGGHNPLRANVRVIAATHQNLETRVRQGLFREDLYHRLNVIRLRLPALRERSEDIPLLTRHFLQKSARELGVEPKRVSDEALAWMSSLPFPGNVRQLENLANWLTVMAPAQTIEIKDLPPDLVPAHGSAGSVVHLADASAASEAGAATNGAGGVSPVGGAVAGAIGGVPGGVVFGTPAFGASNGVAAAVSPLSVWESGLRTEVARLLRENSADVMDELSRRFEAAVIREALDFTRGRKVEAAERLGIGRNTITRKIQELNLE